MGVGRRKLTDRAWAQVAPLLPVNGDRGGQCQDRHRIVDGIPGKLRLIADQGHSHSVTRRPLRQRGIAHVIPERTDQHLRRADHPGRSPSFDPATYRPATSSSGG